MLTAILNQKWTITLSNLITRSAFDIYIFGMEIFAILWFISILFIHLFKLIMDAHSHVIWATILCVFYFVWSWKSVHYISILSKKLRLNYNYYLIFSQCFLIHSTSLQECLPCVANWSKSRDVCCVHSDL